MADDTPDTPQPEAKSAPKPRTRRAPAKSATDKPAATRPKADTAAKAPPKPRSSKRTAAAGTTRAAKTAVAKTRKAATRTGQSVDKATGKVGGRWGVAAIAGGVVAAAGAAAALFTLRGSTPKDGKADPRPNHGARQADGTDSSRSFDAAIADEGTIPNA